MTTTKALVRSSGKRPVMSEAPGLRKVGSYVVKGTACKRSDERLLSVEEMGPEVLGISYLSMRQVPVRKNAKRLRRQTVVRVVLCRKRSMPNGDYFWMAATEQIHTV